MCGIVGAIAINHKSIDIEHTENMVEEILHRGPDDAGYLYFHSGTKHPKGHSFFLNLADKRYPHLAPLSPSIQDEPVKRELYRHDWDVFFGHRRLAILDITDAGHQPMSDLSQNIWLIYNGEIYNYLELKHELEKLGHKFKSKTDTEVIIYSYIEWGINCIEKFNGMFAFALYDNFKKKLYIVRDRYGIKPVYLALVKESDGVTLLFASEIKAFLKYRYFQKDFDYDGIKEYFTFQNFYSDRTFWKNCKILLPGHYVEINLSKQVLPKVAVNSKHSNLITFFEDFKSELRQSNINIQFFQYWDFNPFQEKLKCGENEILTELEKLFENSVKRNLLSDVEIGSYLSGGIDSSSICAIISKLFNEQNRTLKTFTIGFDLHSASGVELTFDERKKSEYISYLLGTEHYEMVLKAGDMQRCMNALIKCLEDTRVGQSYPNFYASKLASKFVKVVMSGTGGDELFGGYPWRYLYVIKSKNFDEFINNYFLFWCRLIPIEKYQDFFNPINIYTNLQPKELMKLVFPEEFRTKLLNSSEDLLELALYFEQKTFLHGLLIVDDKISMRHSLEARVPLLDNELVDYSLKIPIHYKVSNLDKLSLVDENNISQIKKTNDGKVIFRRLVKKFFPDDISESIKQGFSAPDNSWYKGESIEYIKSILLTPNANIYNFFDRNIVHNLLEDHFTGIKNRRLLIWSLLCFEILTKLF